MLSLVCLFFRTSALIPDISNKYRSRAVISDEHVNELVESTGLHFVG
jgi:hypothetical protein